MRYLATMIAVLLCAAAFARATEFRDQEVASASHEEGEAKWTDALVRHSSRECAATSGLGQWAVRRDSKKPPRKDTSDCVLNMVRAHNDSQRPMQCHFTLEYDGTDDADRALVEADRVIFSGGDGASDLSFGPASLAINSFASRCVSIPAKPAPFEKASEECFGSVRVPPPEDFYPPGAKRREEQGTVTLEYGVAEGDTKFRDVLIVGSSGFVDLDNAALKLAAASRTKGQCVDRRYRMKLNFVISDTGPSPLLPAAPQKN